MKLLLAIALICLSSMAKAEPHISDIMYLPKAGTSFSTTTLGIISGKGKSAGTENTISGHTAEQILGHAVTDYVSFNLGIGFHRFDQSLEIEGDTEETIIDSRGVTDPFIGTRLRLVDSLFRVDLTGTITVSIEDREGKDIGDNRREVNSVQGNHSLDLGIEVGQRFENSQWSLFVGMTRNESGVFRDNGQKKDFESSNDYTSRIQAQRDLDHRVTARAFVELSLFEEVKYDAGTRYLPYQSDFSYGGGFYYTSSEDILFFGTGELHQLKFASWDSYNYGVVTLGTTLQF